MIVRGNKPGQIRNRQLHGGAPKGWARLQPKVEHVELGDSTKAPLFAVVSSWHDADVIAATIQNCYEQGCERVYLLDNASPDDTVTVAKRSGVTDVVSYETEFYDDDLRITLQNELVERVTKEEGRDDLWWVVLDADEFPHARTGEPLAQFLGRLPVHVRTVGSDFVELYPSGEDYTGGHPAKSFAKGIWRRGGPQRYCECGHWKHCIVRYRNGSRDIAHFRGNHGLAVRDKKTRPVEPHLDAVFFHAPYRGKEATYARYEALCGNGRNSWDDDVTSGHGAVKRWRSLDAIYEGRWRDVEMSHTQMYGRPIVGLALYPWRVLVPELAEMFGGERGVPPLHMGKFHYEVAERGYTDDAN